MPLPQPTPAPAVIPFRASIIPMPIAPGTRLGPYEVVAALAAGGMGEIYRARDSRLARDVAVKVLPENLATNPDARARFEREARAVAALSHANILAIHDIGDHGGLAYAVMELLEGETLRERLARHYPTWNEAAEIAASVADGVGSAHDKGIVHRDLKPENLFLTSDLPGESMHPRQPLT
jgi:serine/threonine protein kinase